MKEWAEQLSDERGPLLPTARKRLGTKRNGSGPAVA
jgi:hypothetical protein